MRLLALGFAGGARLGFFTGVAMGWSQRVNYWLYPCYGPSALCPPRPGCQWRSWCYQPTP